MNLYLCDEIVISDGSGFFETPFLCIRFCSIFATPNL